MFGFYEIDIRKIKMLSVLAENIVLPCAMPAGGIISIFTIVKT